MTRNTSFQGSSIACALVLASGFAALCAPGASAETNLRCSETARAYATGEIGGIWGSEFLKSCITKEIQARKIAAEVRKNKPEGATIPTICHQRAGQFAIQPGAMSAAELAYFEACIDADIQYRKEGR